MSRKRPVLRFLASATAAVMFLSAGSQGPARLDAGGQGFAASAGLGPQVSADARHDISPPLRSMPFRPPSQKPDREVPLRVPPRVRGKRTAIDPVAQTQPGALATPSVSNSFEGLSDADNAAVLGYRVVPPDTNGDVGPKDYVQVVNILLAVYDKTTGVRRFGPKPINTLWSGFGGICETHNDGDPIILHDQLADRWIVSQLAVGTDGHQCIAVSTTTDPTDSYYRYDFLVSPGGTNDYPKFGLWPDAYYMTANQFNGGFQGAIAVAFQREPMLSGASAQMVKFGPLPCAVECFFSLQPSHLAGTSPPVGTPNTFIMAFDDQTWGTGLNADGYRLWNFSVKWLTPASSTFTPLGQVNAPGFDSNLCNYSRQCIPQPKPGERLDSLSQFTMYRAQYRWFGSYAALVVNHTVDVNGQDRAGIRWAELRNSGSGWSLNQNQTGTYSPDSKHRWAGSIAMDKNGNIALGYSVSSSTVAPSIRYTTRTASDLPGQMGTEAILRSGQGVQYRSYNRWGDYSTMSIDPSDDCTFWYTQEYYANSGSFNFKTRFGSFKMPDCR